MAAERVDGPGEAGSGALRLPGRADTTGGVFDVAAEATGKAVEALGEGTEGKGEAIGAEGEGTAEAIGAKGEGTAAKAEAVGAKAEGTEAKGDGTEAKAEAVGAKAEGTAEAVGAKAEGTAEAVGAKAEGTEKAVEAKAEATEKAVEARADAVLAARPRLARAADLVGGVVHQQSAEQVSLAASGAAFWLIISSFPTAVAVVSLFGLIVPPAKVADDLGALARAAPSSLGSLITDQLRRVAASDRRRLSIGLAVSLVTAAWSASTGVYNLDRAVRYSFGLPRSPYLRARARALSGAGALVVVLGALALAASVVGARAPAGLVLGAGIPAALVTVTAGTATMYRLALGPMVPLRRLLPGAVAAATMSVISLTAFALYLAASTRFTALYGTFAGMAIGMVGMYMAVYAALLGAVLDARLMKSAGKGARGSAS